VSYPTVRSEISLWRPWVRHTNPTACATLKTEQKALDLDPSFVTARPYLATAYMQQFTPGVLSPENDLMAVNALENFQRFLTADPGNKVAMASVASLHLNQKKWDDAQQWYDRMIAADPRNPDVYYSLAFIGWSK
jgi:cytochrome c-type biogenesis protein CcmH/NrfG